ALTCYAKAGDFDLINDHSGPLAAALGAAPAVPVCHTVHGPLTGEPGDVYSLIGRVSPSVGLISISDSQREPLPDLNWLANCHDEKVRLLQRATVTVFPIQWPEPFGLVMVESMACGTPVVATRFGAVPEVIEDGRSGVIVDDFDQLAGAVQRAATLRPEDCRA